MPLIQKLSHLRDIVPARREMLRIAGLRAWPGIADMKIRDVPILNQAAELRDDAEFLELTEPFDGQHGWVVEDVVLPFLEHTLLPVRGLVRDRGTTPV